MGYALGLVVAALGLFAGPAAIGTAPSNLAATQHPDVWFTKAFALIVLGAVIGWVAWVQQRRYRIQRALCEAELQGDRDPDAPTD